MVLDLTDNAAAGWVGLGLLGVSVWHVASIVKHAADHVPVSQAELGRVPGRGQADTQPRALYERGALTNRRRAIA